MQYRAEHKMKKKNVKLTIEMSMTFTHCNDYVRQEISILKCLFLYFHAGGNQTECSELEMKLHLVAFKTKSSKSISQGYVLN